MDLIIGFCILFIGYLLLWQFSKIILIKTVETLSTIDPPPPKSIDLIQYSPTVTSDIQFKINEVIEAFNKINKEETDYKNKDSKEPNKYNYVPVKELDLSIINGTDNELFVIQTTLNELIDKIGVSIIDLNISNRATPPKKINYIKVNLNIIINAFNKYMHNKYDKLKEVIAKITIEGQKQQAIATNRINAASATSSALLEN